MTIRGAKLLFLIAGIYGVIVVFPLFFLESEISRRDPPPISHPEFYYGFVCAALAWQVVYLLMSRDPIRFRFMLIPACIGKAGFAVSAGVLCALGRLPARNLVLPSIDLILVVLFIYAFVALGRTGNAAHE